MYVLLDSNIWIDLLLAPDQSRSRAHEATLARLDDPDLLVTPTVIREVRARLARHPGLRDTFDSYVRQMQATGHLLPETPSVEATVQLIELAAGSAGHPIAAPEQADDRRIAATAIVHGVPLLANDIAFKNIGGLEHVSSIKLKNPRPVPEILPVHLEPPTWTSSTPRKPTALIDLTASDYAARRLEAEFLDAVGARKQRLIASLQREYQQEQQRQVPTPEVEPPSPSP